MYPIAYGLVLKCVALSLFLVLAVPSVILAAENKPGNQVSEQPDTAAASAEEEGLLDWHKHQVDTQVQRAANWVDSFFLDPNYQAEVVTTQFRVRPELHYRSEQGAKARLKLSLKLSLPNFNRKTSLIIGKEPDDGDFEDTGDGRGEDSIVGLQFFGKKRTRLHTSVSVGAKFNEFAFFVGPRVSYGKAVGKKSLFRLTQTVRWQTNDYWQIYSRLDLNHVINDGYLFRQVFDGRWRGERSEEEGYRTRISSFLIQRLGVTSGLFYEFSTIFHTRPETHVNRYTLGVRYRKKTSRDWLYYEIVPEVSFEDEFDYKANPGLRLRLEFFYGEDPQGQLRRHRLEDTEEFQW